MKKISALGFVVLFFMSCGSAQKGADQEGAITSILWETEGGGDIQFEITPAGSAYQIRVTRHAFQEVETFKVDSISKMCGSKRNSLNDLRAELAKCIPLCCNCHQRREAKAGNFYWWL